jgi:tetratricopeptide (TPR) repeat protein
LRSHEICGKVRQGNQHYGSGVMSIGVFLSAVSDEFRPYRDQLRSDLTRHDVEVKVQEDFKDLGRDTLDKIDLYIANCDAVVHLVGDMCGAVADERQQQALLAKHSDLQQKLPPLGEALKTGICLPYTQWEAWLALYYDKLLLIAKAKALAPRGPRYAPDDAMRVEQADHLERLKAFHHYPGSEFGSADELAKQIAYTAILDLLVAAYAANLVQQREVAEGFIREMAKRVAGDAALNLDGMRQAVRNAIEIYEGEIAGRPAKTNFDDIVDRALARAKEQVDRGQSSLARATLRRAAMEMRREDEERREHYVAGVTQLYIRERDIALATHDGPAAVSAILELAQALHANDSISLVALLEAESSSLHEYGRDRGSNVHLIAEISLRREVLSLAKGRDEAERAKVFLGIALLELGERHSATARFEDAVAAYRAALEEWTREGVPLQWAMTQNNLGNALCALGERESGSGTARFEEAVAAYRAALEEWTRERVPVYWAGTQSNLGAALCTIGQRESGTGKLKEAVAAYRAALDEWTRERVPLDWAMMQNKLGNALARLGDRESGTARLEEAVVAFRAALEVRARGRDPLDWATTQNNLGHALERLWEREGGTGKLDEAVASYRAAILERLQAFLEQHPQRFAD